VAGGILDIWLHVADGPQFSSDGDCKTAAAPCAIDR
jgi:hypothetical protein